MFAKLKKKIAEEAATAPRSGVRIPRTISKESITSVGADSGDDFASDGSSSRDDLPAQLLRRNDQIRRLEAKLSDYAEQLRIMQKTKDKLEIALERHQDLSIKKFQDQNETHQASRAKMAEGMTLALEKKDQEWIEKMADVEKEKTALSAQLEEMMEQSLALFQKRDDLDELEGFQQQELAKVKHMLLRKEEQLSQQERELQKKDAEVQSARRELSKARGKLQLLEQQHEESCRLNTELEIEREDLLLLREEADKKTGELEGRCQELHSVIQQVSEDFQKVSIGAQVFIDHLSRSKVTSLDRRLQGNLSQDEHLQELLQEKSSLEQSLEETRAELLAVRTNHADTVSSLEAQVNQCSYSNPGPRIYYHTSELSSRQTVSTEIAKALEESRRQKEELQTQVSGYTHLLPLDQSNTNLDISHSQLVRRGAEWEGLTDPAAGGGGAAASPAAAGGVGQRLAADRPEEGAAQPDPAAGRLPGQTRDDGVLCVVQVSYLEVEVDTLTEQLHSPEVCEEDQNGSVTVDDLDHIQKVNRELEQQLSDKNKTIKQLQQRLAELKRTLQKELVRRPEKQERFCPEPPPASALSPPTSNTTVTNTSDLNDSREINFEYLKHVVLKFMSSREAEAFQLIRAVSVLLNFTREEEDMLKQTLEYKMSWFGSKPSPKGIIRPSVSGASSPWS
uniref:Golgin subfamily A member 1 n=1 Tax=Scophthalmus maximus TaxID=52904 RepID=A0A8D3D060_SCOMX